MNSLRLTVNGAAVTQAVEPRTSLADLLRENLHLTGTHLGCEQGVCGACTVIVDGVPVRSCISNATCCGGAEVRTIEDFDEDPLMIELRQAFNAHHALQCGFCTPGMLIMARDIVERLGDADEQRIRLELAGNLCRCTGYSGIVKAVRSVIMAQENRVAATARSAGLGPAGSGHGAADKTTVSSAISPRQPAVALSAGKTQFGTPGKIGASAPSVKQSFVIDHPPDVIWRQFGNVPAMVRCIPGAVLVGETEDGNYQVNMRVKMGPIGAQFAGIANQQRDDRTMTGVIHGAGRDERSASLAQGELSYALHEEQGGAATRVDLDVKYTLSGALGQFARGGIVTHFIGAITAQFTENLRRSLSPDADHPQSGEANELRLVGSLAMALKSWLGDLRRKLFSR
jgi:carbon-monoxide dehydrogenase small subunit